MCMWAVILSNLVTTASRVRCPTGQLKQLTAMSTTWSQLSCRMCKASIVPRYVIKAKVSRGC